MSANADPESLPEPEPKVKRTGVRPEIREIPKLRLASVAVAVVLLVVFDWLQLLYAQEGILFASVDCVFVECVCYSVA
jgi:hypothetical protein